MREIACGQLFHGGRRRGSPITWKKTRRSMRERGRSPPPLTVRKVRKVVSLVFRARVLMGGEK